VPVIIEENESKRAAASAGPPKRPKKGQLDAWIEPRKVRRRAIQEARRRNKDTGAQAIDKVRDWAQVVRDRKITGLLARAEDKPRPKPKPKPTDQHLA
jgi:hypothetical protein